MRMFVFGSIVALAALSVAAQDSTTPSPVAKARVVAELASAAAAQHGAMKNSPLSAEEVNESVQTLADGNRIVRSSTGKYYRNSAGRVRREGSGGVGGVLGSTYTFSPGVSIVNPAIGQKYLLDSQLKTARVIELAQGQRELAIEGLRSTSPAERDKAVAKMREELKLVTKEHDGLTVAGQAVPAAPVAPLAPLPPMPTMIAPTGQGGAFTYSTAGVVTKYETRTEDLGTRDFEGVSAEGTRRTTIIPAGAIGNERPIEVVYERWYSKELGLVVYSKNSDPRFGEQTYRLTNIMRSEPDPSLFSVPTEYRKVDGSGTLYRVATDGRSLKNPVAAKPVMTSASKARP